MVIQLLVLVIWTEGSRIQGTPISRTRHVTIRFSVASRCANTQTEQTILRKLCAVTLRTKPYGLSRQNLFVISGTTKKRRLQISDCLEQTWIVWGFWNPKRCAHSCPEPWATLAEMHQRRLVGAPITLLSITNPNIING